MDPTREPTLPIRHGQGKEAPLSEKHVQQTASAHTRYVTVLNPQSAVNPTQQDATEIPKGPSPSHQDVQLFQHTPPQTSRYVRMLLQLDWIPRLRNVLANLFTWLILAGYIVFPGTFTSLRRSNVIKNAANRDKPERLIVDTVQNVTPPEPRRSRTSCPT
jgi:hypothetical protein